MSGSDHSFVEVCLYEVRTDKVDEFEALVRRVAAHHRAANGSRDVRYVRRTHRAGDFNAVKQGKPAVPLVRASKTVTYILYWELDGAKDHGRATKSGLEHFYREFRRCLVTAPKILLGTRIE